MTDGRDSFPPLPSAQPTHVDPAEIDWSTPIRRPISLADFLRTVPNQAGQYIEIRPGSDTLVPSITLFTGAPFTAGEPLIEVVDVGGGEWALKLAGPNDGSGAPEFYLRSDGIILWSVAGSEVGRLTASGLRGVEAHSDEDIGTAASFTNTGYADLNALTGTSLASAVAVTVTTGTRALVMVSGQMDNSGGSTALTYRVSGATTIAGSDNSSVILSSTAFSTGAFQEEVALTAGSNVFELQARVSAGTGGLRRARLTVIPL